MTYCKNCVDLRKNKIYHKCHLHQTVPTELEIKNYFKEEKNMSKRIRYVNTSQEGVLVSKQHFIHPENGSRYLVQIDEPNLTFKVMEDLTGKTVAEGRKVNLHQVKQAAKEKLMSLGIVFENEVRAVKLTPSN